MDWSTLALLHLLATGFLTGLIWFVQVVHYPLLAAVGARGFRAYERAHCRRTTWVVLPAMTAELGLAVWLVFAAPPAASGWTLVGLGLLLLIWASTFFVQVPCHDRLQAGFDPTAHARLVRSNWLRTAAWSLRLGVAAGLLGQAG